MKEKQQTQAAEAIKPLIKGGRAPEEHRKTKGASQKR